jgi:hypothetical protein
MWKLSSEVSGCSWCRRFFGPNTVIRGRPKCPTTTAFFFSTCGLTMRTTGSSSHRDDRRSNSCLRSRVSRSRADSFVELHLPVAVPFIVTSRNGSNGFGDGDDIWCRELSAFQSLSLLCLGFAFCRTFRPKARRPSHFSSRLIKQKRRCKQLDLPPDPHLSSAEGRAASSAFPPFHNSKWRQCRQSCLVASVVRPLHDLHEFQGFFPTSLGTAAANRRRITKTIRVRYHRLSFVTRVRLLLSRFPTS